MLGACYGVNRTGLDGVGGALLGAGGHPHHCFVNTDDARQAHGATPAGDDAKLCFREADLGRFTHYTEVTGQANFQAATQGEAVDGCRRGIGQGRQAIEILVVSTGEGFNFFDAGTSHADELGDVGADDEYGLAAGDQQALNATLGFQCVQPSGQAGDGGIVEFVNGFALQVEVQLGDVAIQAFDRELVTLVDHIGVLSQVGGVDLGAVSVVNARAGGHKCS